MIRAYATEIHAVYMAEHMAEHVIRAYGKPTSTVVLAHLLATVSHIPIQQQTVSQLNANHLQFVYLTFCISRIGEPSYDQRGGGGYPARSPPAKTLGSLVLPFSGDTSGDPQRFVVKSPMAWRTFSSVTSEPKADMTKSAFVAIHVRHSGA